MFKITEHIPHDFCTGVALSIVLLKFHIQDIHMAFTKELTLVKLSLDKYQTQISNVLWEMHILFPQEMSSMAM